MMDNVDALDFSREWAAAWNRRDVEAILDHFHDDVVFTSPLARQLGYAEDGIVRGKAALRTYWTRALAQNPDLHFQVTAAYQGVNTLVIAFTNERGLARCEVLSIRDGLVAEGHGATVAAQARP